MVLDAAKDYLLANRFGSVGFACVIFHFFCALAFTAVTAALNNVENDGKFFCPLDPESTTAYKKQVEQECLTSYNDVYNSPVPLYAFVLLSIDFPVVVSVIYSVIVKKEVDEIESRYKRQIDGKAVDRGQNGQTTHVFYSYFAHLVLRGLFVIALTVLQHTYFYPNGFDFKFNCNLPATDQVTSSINTSKNTSRNLNGTSVTCKNATASGKWISGICVSAVNSIVAIVILVEVFYLLPRLPVFKRHSKVGWNDDSHFVIEYFLGKPYSAPSENELLTNNPLPGSIQDYNISSDFVVNDSIQDTTNEDNSNFIAQACSTIENDIPDTRNENTPGSIAQECTTNGNDIQDTTNEDTPDPVAQECPTIDNDIQDIRNENTPDFITQECVTIDNNIQDFGSDDCIHFYKEHILNRSRDYDIFYGRNVNIDNIYIDVVIHTEQAQHNFPEVKRNEIKRHEIYDVYMEVPRSSICLEKIVKLFYLNADKNEEFPCSILVIGRPGIGKTVLTEKILRDWANGIDEYYSAKIVFCFKFRLFNENFSSSTNFSLKTFLQLGTRLSEERFESIYEEIIKEPKRAILIFDGLDEYHGDPTSCLDQSRSIPSNHHTSMSAMSLFIKIISRDLLEGATVVVTSRPTAVDFYSRLDFVRQVEIIGFTRDKIEEYVSRFCNNNSTNDLTTKMWNHIKSSSELLNLCYIPVNCFVVCVTLSGCLRDPRNKTGALPTTLTELYQKALDYVEKYHHRNANRNSTQHGTLKQLQRLAFRGMENGQLVFNQASVNKEMKTSGLLNSLSNPIYPLETQFCFIHLTIQEFLAARHVTETFGPLEIKTFISEHVESGKWHLVLQFIAGLLGIKLNSNEWEYKDCVFAFAKSLKVRNGEIRLSYQEVFIMKCLTEVDNKKITKEVCQTTSINDLVKLQAVNYGLSQNEWAAVTFVCKRMKELANLTFSIVDADCVSQILGLLRQKCLNKLEMHVENASVTVAVDIDQVLSALMTLNCTSNHKHAKLISLALHGFRVTETGLTIICNFLKNEHASQLGQFTLSSIRVGSHKLCGFLNKAHCPNLTHLCLQNNSMTGEDGELLFDIMTKALPNLNTLDVSINNFTDGCIPTLVKALQDERCGLTDVSLARNAIGDKGAVMLFEDALTNKHCKLTTLNLDRCSLTGQCIPSLCLTLQDERCQLAGLSMGFNAIGDEGVVMLFEDALTKKHCKLNTLKLHNCSLTGQYVHRLCMVLKDERCELKTLSLIFNNFSENGERLLRDTMNYESGEARDLKVHV